VLGRAGTVNVLLHDWFGLTTPINFMYGMHGVLLVETLHLFPFMTLSILDSLSKVDPSLEEAAQVVGAKGWRRFWDVTLPLTTPGYVSGALLVFIWTFADFVTPLVVGVQDLLAVQAYLNIVQFVDRRIFRMGIVISALLVVLAIVFVLVARHYVAIKDYSSLAYSRVERRPLGPVARWLAVGLLALLMFVSLLPQAGVVLAAVGKGWSLTPLPLHYTLDTFRQVSLETPKFIVNSLLYSGIAVFICLAVGVPMAWIMARTRTPGRGAMDALTTLILAIPGTAIGIAYIRAFHYPLPTIDVALTSGARRPPAALHRAQQLFVALARAQVDGGGGRERRRHQAENVQGHHRAAGVEGHPRRRAVFLHHVDPGGVRHPVPHAGRLGDDPVRNLHLLHRGLPQPGGSARRDPDRALCRESLGSQSRSGRARRRAVRVR